MMFKCSTYLPLWARVEADGGGGDLKARSWSSTSERGQQAEDVGG